MKADAASSGFIQATRLVCLLCAVLILAGCATSRPNTSARGLESKPGVNRSLGALAAETKEKIMALDPERVEDRDVRDLLSNAPAPRIISIHGGLFPIKGSMDSFSQFLVGMGYPESSMQNPGNGDYTYGHYDRSERIAGEVAWHYEREGLRPMIVGHSLGGIQAVRVLHKLAGDSAKSLAVWDPVADREEDRDEIIDPLTGTARPVVGVQLSYAAASMAGGVARLLPNEWDMNTRLRKIPDSVEEFTGFQKGLDLLGGDYLGYGTANDYYPMGKAFVRNVRLPAACAHTTIPYTKNLLKDPEIVAWINNYRPNGQAVDGTELSRRFGLRSGQVLWAAEVWYSIKKHWVLELQRLIRAKWAQDNARQARR